MPKESISVGQEFGVYENDLSAYDFSQPEEVFNKLPTKYKLCTYQELIDFTQNTYEQVVCRVFTDYFNDMNDPNAVYDCAKLHWLIHDIKIFGLSYAPQGILIDKEFAPHPGTFRFVALYMENKLYNSFPNQKIIVVDTQSTSNFKTLTFLEWLEACTTGFLRKNRNVRIMYPREQQLEVQESNNFHDDCIRAHTEDLYELFHSNAPTIFFRPNSREKIKNAIIDDLEKFPTKVFVESIYTLPSLCDYSGVSVYIDQDVTLHQSIYCFISQLNFTDSVVYTSDKKILIFNNSHPDVRKLSEAIVGESNEAFLEDMRWTAHSKELPHSIKGDWYDF